MTTPYDPATVDQFLNHYWALHPVDATFMGETGHDHRLPPAGPGTLGDELAGIARLKAQLRDTAEPADLGDRLDRALMLAELTIQRAAATHRQRLHNPAWYSGEAAFSVIALLLPQSAPVRHDALIARLDAIGPFWPRLRRG